ncbi:MAG: DUF998 domain-containing protein [Candidatus Saccharimonadales bacterium]
MMGSKKLKLFNNRFDLIGSGLWIFSLQYFAVQAVVALNWPRPYSLGANTISDLGNTVCGPYGGRLVCSPLHDLMNASFIVLGLMQGIGALLIYRKLRGGWALKAVFGGLILSDVGTILVGFFPENTVASLHILGAGLAFLLGSLAILGFSLLLKNLPKSWRIYTFLTGLIAFLALIFYVGHDYFGLGPGSLERLISYPQTVWVVLFGFRLLVIGSRCYPKT